jgi:hypothetical protein
MNDELQPVRLKIYTRDGGEWNIQPKPEALAPLHNLPSGKLITLQRQTKGDVQIQNILIKPYYRRVIHGELVIFAVEVEAPSEQQ